MAIAVLEGKLDLDQESTACAFAAHCLRMQIVEWEAAAEMKDPRARRIDWALRLVKDFGYTKRGAAARCTDTEESKERLLRAMRARMAAARGRKKSR